MALRTPCQPPTARIDVRCCASGRRRHQEPAGPCRLVAQFHALGCARCALPFDYHPTARVVLRRREKAMLSFLASKKAAADANRARLQRSLGVLPVFVYDSRVCRWLGWEAMTLPGVILFGSPPFNVINRARPRTSGRAEGHSTECVVVVSRRVRGCGTRVSCAVASHKPSKGLPVSCAGNLVFRRSHSDP